MPEPYLLKQTEESPAIILDKENGKFEFTGSSLPENASKFFQPSIDWIVEYIKDPNDNTIITCQFEYLNSSSSRKMFEILSRFQEIKETGKKVEVAWLCNAQDTFIEEKGMELKLILNIPFEVHHIE